MSTVVQLKGLHHQSPDLSYLGYGADQHELGLPAVSVPFHQGLKWHLGCNKDHFRLNDMFVQGRGIFSVSSRIFWKGSKFFFSLAHIRNWERHMNPCRALWSRYLSERKHVFALGLGWWRGLEISFGVLESSPLVLEEEGLEDGVSSLEVSSLGQ